MNAQNYNDNEKMLTDIEPESKSENKNHFCFIEEKHGERLSNYFDLRITSQFDYF